jgi:hypothetical protein
MNILSLHPSRVLEICSLLALSACGKSKLQASLSLNMVYTPASVNLSLTPDQMKQLLDDSGIEDKDFSQGSGGADLSTFEVSFVPESILFPIGTISTRDSISGFSGKTVYTCAASSAEGCRVDLADKAAIESLLKDAVLTVKKESSDRKEKGKEALVTVAALQID